MYHAFHALDLSLLRRSFAADPIAPLQPQAAYYVMRNLATALEDVQPAQFGYQLATRAEVEAYTLSGPHDRVLALWRPGRASDECQGMPVDVSVDLTCHAASAYDPMNGTVQTLLSEQQGARTCLRGILVRDYPILLRFA